MDAILLRRSLTDSTSPPAKPAMFFEECFMTDRHEEGRHVNGTFTLIILCIGLSIEDVRLAEGAVFEEMHKEMPPKPAISEYKTGATVNRFNCEQPTKLFVGMLLVGKKNCPLPAPPRSVAGTPEMILRNPRVWSEPPPPYSLLQSQLPSPPPVSLPSPLPSSFPPWPSPPTLPLPLLPRHHRNSHCPVILLEVSSTVFTDRLQ